MALTLLCTAALGAWPRGANAAGASGTAGAPGQRSALVVFLPAGESELAGVGDLSVGIVSATQGRYSSAQFLLDVTQGARVASSAYPSASPPPLSLTPAGGGAVIDGWQAARRRAQAAPQLLRPGLLAAQIPGAAGYAGITGGTHVDGALAADLGGRVAALSLGPASTLLARVAALQRRERLVVADLPGGGEGRGDLLALSEGRTAGELLIALQRAPDAGGHELLWGAVAGLGGGGGRELSSQSTNERGLIVAVDVAPTILGHLGVPVPADMRGKPIETDGALRPASLRALMARLHVIGGRRLTALGCLLGAWALLLALAAPWTRARAWAMRAGALGVLWAPVAVLIPAALEPSAAVEYATIALACMALGALTDALVPWPRALLAPAIVAILALSTDALAGTQLLMRSLLGPDPILGARFYGIGNELKSGLAVLVLAAVAAALTPAVRGRRAALSMASAGVVLAVVEGSARIGAGVGGVILVSFAFALATIMLAPGSLTRRRALIVLVSPLAGLVALAGIDLATAHGGGHFTGSVLHVRSANDLRDVIVRRYGAAWDELRNQAMPVATALALLCAGLGLRRRAHLLAPVGGDPAWLAALAGGLAAGVVGALVEDSGPVLLVVAVFTLGCVLSYLWGKPRADADLERPRLSTRREEHYSSSPGIGSIGSSS
ncbi:MAG: hypothetical protein ACLQBY_19010 [Solirubrobacteraceae bacterium]